ncbi:MAG TPA: hypothetical protein VF242_08955 [Nitrososphaeraceae archaeon]
MQISGTSWDVTSHLMFKPETFFTPSHALLYSGIGLITIATVLITFLYIKNKHSITNTSAKSSFQLLLIGSVVSIISGPADYLWHQTFGIDGLLSPTHISLMTGMLITSIGVVIGLARIKIPSTKKNSNLEPLRKIALIPAFAALWFTIIWYVYFFSLPFSNGDSFNFNLNPYLASIIATLFLPLFGSIIFFIASKTMSRLGAVSAIGGLVIITNFFSNIFSTDGILFSSILWYFPLSFIPLIISDFLVNNPTFRKTDYELKSIKIIVAAVVIGAGFYIFNYPMVVWAYAIPFEMPLLENNQELPLMSQLISNFTATLPIMLIISIPLGAISGVIGYLIANKMIKSKNTNKEDNHINDNSIEINRS